MADAKKCDRCGQFYMDRDKKASVNNKVINYVSLINHDGYRIKQYDLCQKCCEELLEFLGEKTDVK